MLPKSQFLRYIVYVYGNIGIQLFPVNSFYGILNLLQNQLLNLLTRNAILKSPLFNGSGFMDYIKQTKPFFGRFLEATITRLFPLSTFAVVLHYVLYGRQIVTLLDSDLLRQPYQEKTKKFLALKFAGMLFTFVFINIGNFISLITFGGNFSLFEILYNIFSLFCMTAIGYFHFFCLHYLLYSTIVNLRQIELKLSQKLTKNEENTLIDQFIQLATLNRRLYSLVATQVVLGFPLTIINSAMSLYLYFLIIQAWFILAFPLFNIAYILYLVSLNRRVLFLAKRIFQTVKQRNQTESRPLRTTLHWYNGQQGAQAYSPTSRLIRRFELDLYLDYYRFSVFNLVTIDRGFLLGTALVTLNYTIFIYQT